MSAAPPLSVDLVETTASERRESVRHLCKLNAVCQPITMLEGNRWPGLAADISTGGVSLILSRRFEPGTLLAVGLKGAADSSCLPVAKVMRVSPHGVYWRLGCCWSNAVSTDDLQPLLGAAARTNPVAKTKPASSTKETQLLMVLKRKPR